MKSWTKFRDRFIEASLDLMWGQWRALGLETAQDHQPTSVDLEGLLIGTWTIGRVDPRLFDAALSWCCKEGEVVHQKRLKTLIERIDDEELSAVATAWGRVVEAHGGSNGWYTSDQSLPEEGRSLFLDKQLGEQLESPRDQSDVDRQFSAVGWRRGKFTPRDDIGRPKLRRPENLQLFCRRFFGMGRRAAVMIPLLYGFELTTGELEQWTMYSRRSVQGVLQDLKQAEVLDWDPGRGRTTRASLTEQFRRGFQRMLGDDDTPQGWQGRIEAKDWADFYAGLAVLWRAVLTIEQRGYDEFKGQSVLQDALQNAYEIQSRMPGFSVRRPSRSAAAFEDMIRNAIDYLEGLFPT
jgi:hypothetical protein